MQYIQVALNQFILFILALLIQASAEIIIVREPMNTTACAHQNASFYCGFTGVNPLQLILNWSIIWRDESGSVAIARNYSVFTINIDPNNGLEWIPDLNNSNNSKLVIDSVNEMFNLSSFQCIIPSVNGNHIASAIGFLEVAGPPIIYNRDVVVKSDEICLNDLTVHWTSFSHLECGSVKYNVTLYLGILKVDHIATFNSSYNFTNLQENTAYIFTVFGSNMAGQGDVITTSFRTSQLNDEPKITKIESCLTDITVYWESVNSTSCGGVLYYNITLYRNLSPLNTYTTTDLFYNFTGLQNSTSYSVTVTSVTRAGNGRSSQHMLVETLQPKNVHLFAKSSGYIVNGSDFNISWTAPFVDRCTLPITGYIVVISFNGNAQSSNRVLPFNTTSILLSEYFSNHPINPETVYDVSVIAVNKIYNYIPINFSNVTNSTNDTVEPSKNTCKKESKFSDNCKTIVISTICTICFLVFVICLISIGSFCFHKRPCQRWSLNSNLPDTDDENQPDNNDEKPTGNNGTVFENPAYEDEQLRS